MKQTRIPTRIFIGLFALAMGASPGWAGTRDQPSTLNSSNSLSAETHLYTYRYALTNPAGSSAPLDTLVVKLEPGVDIITNIKAPPGWRAFYAKEKGTVMWAAVGYLDSNAEDPSGNVPPSDYALAPGSTLSGFSFDSFSGPGTGLAISQSYAPLLTPQSDDEFEAAETSLEISTLPEDNGYRLATVVPVPDADWTGNRRPSVDGFLVFANAQDKTSFQGSALIVLRLSIGGEVVDPSTLRVMLNSVDITSQFAWNAEYNGYAATLTSSPLEVGNNVLRTSIEGVVPGTTERRATDTDRLTFSFTQ